MTDLTKPVQAACGLEAEVIATGKNGPDGCSVVVAIDGKLYWYHGDGRTTAGRRVMGDLKTRLREFEGSDALGNGDFAVVYEAADRIEALEAEVARLQSLVWRAQLNTPEQYQSWHEDARQALKGTPNDT